MYSMRWPVNHYVLVLSCTISNRKLLKEVNAFFAVVYFGYIPSSSVSLHRKNKYSERCKVGVQSYRQ
jgi:hypothetical protein